MEELHTAPPANNKPAEILVLDEQEERLLGLEPSPSQSQKIHNWLDETYGPLPELPSAPNASWVSSLGSELAKNWRAGLTVSLVSVPLSLSLAIANGGTPVMGMTTAVWAGLMSALFGGSQFNIHGPTGALSGIVSSAAAAHGPEVLPFISILSGLLALVFFLLRLDKYCLFIPSAVMHGFTLGVAVIIAFGQLPFAFGLESPKHPEFYMNVLESLSNLGSLNPWAALIFLVFCASLLMLLNRWPKVPWMMVAAAFGVALGFSVSRSWLPSSLGLISLKDRYGTLAPRLFSVTSFKASYFDRSVFLAAVPVCFISVLETLISAKIADRLTGTTFQQPQEVLALGVANIVAGVFGGIPATAALARTALNIKSGATSRVAGVINAIGVALISLLLLRAFQFLLLPVIASILVVVAFRMVELEALHHMWVHDRKMFGLCVFVTIVVIGFGPTEGIIVGAIVALFMFAVHNARGHGEALVGKQGEATLSAVSLEAIDKNFVEQKMKPSAAKVFGDTIVYRIPGELTYLNAPSHIARVKKLGREYRNVILALRYVFYVDVDGLDALGDIVHDLEANDKRVLLSGVQPGSVRDMLEQAKWFVEKKASGMVFSSYRDALAALDPATNAIADDDNDRAPCSLSRVAEPIEMEEFSRV